jgi:hypothetical protein
MTCTLCGVMVAMDECAGEEGRGFQGMRGPRDLVRSFDHRSPTVLTSTCVPDIRAGASTKMTDRRGVVFLFT